MTTKRLLIAAVLITVCANAFALNPQNEAWGKSAVHFLFTEEEAAAWKNIKTDEEAQAFINLFWARRDPTPATPRNEFKETIEARIKAADERFGTTGRKKVTGSMSDRGMVLVVFGQPSRISRRQAAAAGDVVGNEHYQIWLYEGENTRQLFGMQRAELTFADRSGTEEYRLERGGIDVTGSRKRVAAAYITQPDLTKAPEFTSVPMAGSAVTPPAAVTIQTALTTPALISAIDAVKGATANPYANTAFVSFGEFVTAQGTYFVPVSLYVPKGSPAAASKDVTFFGVIEDESGKPVLAFEEPATLGVTRDDFFIEKSLRGLPAGKHRGFFGLAAGGKTVTLVPVEMQLAGSLDKDAPAASPLILSNNVYPLTEAQGPTDPFAFGGVKVVPKSDKAFRSSDELWYFVELRNPGLSEAGAPSVQVKMDVTGKDTTGKAVKMSAPLSEVAAIEMKGVPGHYAVGSAIPLASFKPGDYTFTVKVIDTVKKNSYTLSETFKVVE